MRSISNAARDVSGNHRTTDRMPKLRTVAVLALGAAMAQAASASTALAQQPVPIRELSLPEAKTTQPFGNIFGLRALKGGGVLVNDGVRRQLVALDPTLSTHTVVVDSVTEGGQSYGPRPSPFIPYLADSTLFVDGASLSLLVLDPSGKIAHVMSAPKPSDLRFLAGGTSGVDAQGNLLYRAPVMMTRNASAGAATKGKPPEPPQPPDSSAIVRANFETRGVDTVGRVKIQSGMRVAVNQGADGKMTITTTINPISTVDDWAVLSDGTIAFIRGQDYHIDFISRDGKHFSTPKLPFDWKRLTDEDKQALIDSSRTAQEKQAADAKVAAANPASAAGLSTDMAVGGGGGGGPVMVVMRSIEGGSGGGVSIGGGAPGGASPMATMSISGASKLEFVPIKEISDYYPAIRPNAAKADLDGNLWILTTTSAQSKAGELIYDVVNNKGQLYQRVRMPLGRSIAGFGHNGVVYLMHRDANVGWFLERTKIVNSGDTPF